MRVGAAAGVIVALSCGSSANADIVIFEQTGVASGVFSTPVEALPGAGSYRLEFSSSLPVFFEIVAGYTYHWDIFIAPPPRPHSEFLEGNSFEIEDRLTEVGVSGALTFMVPETSYTFFPAVGYDYLGVADGTPLYEEVKYESPYFYFYSDGGLGSTYEYALTVVRLNNGGVIPEPSTWALLILGFGLVGAALRRGRSRSLRAI